MKAEKSNGFSRLVVLGGIILTAMAREVTGASHNYAEALSKSILFFEAKGLLIYLLTTYGL